MAPALADQLDGNEENHEKYRQIVVQYIRTHRDDFEPFIEDEVPFDEYCKKIEKDGTWAGHMELQAASLVTGRNISIHRAMSPRWYICNFGDREASMIHLSYHDGEHYNSVRLKEDPCEGPTRPITIKADANISASDHKQKCKANETKGSSHNSLYGAVSVKLVMEGTRCKNLSKIGQVLQEVGGDVDAAIEFLISEKERIENTDSLGFEDYGYHQAMSNEETEVSSREMIPKQPLQLELASRGTLTSDMTPKTDPQINKHDDKRIPRNKECPCGSRKKYKACCGSAIRKSSAVVVSMNSGSSKRRKDTKKGKNKEPVRSASASELKVIDLGALCI